jgi:hypothetical protein
MVPLGLLLDFFFFFFFFEDATFVFDEDDVI